MSNDMTSVAARNLTSFIRSATFRNEVDREAALNCLQTLRDAIAQSAETLTRPADGERMPTVPQAFFDEFGVNADDRVMDYGRACYDAGVLSAAPQQHGQEVVRTCMNPCTYIDFFNGHACDKCLGTIFSPAHVRAQQPAEAVAYRVVDANGVPCPVFGKWVEAGFWESSEAIKPVLREGFRYQYAYTTPPPAIDIGKLRELVALAVDDAMIERAARALCKSRSVGPEVLHIDTTGKMPIDGTVVAMVDGKLAERPAFFGWRKQVVHARAALEAALIGDSGEHA